MTPTFVTDAQGNVFINDMTRYIKGDLLVPPAIHNPLTIPAAPGAGLFTQSDPVIIEGGEDAITEIFSLVGVQRGAFADVNNRLTMRIRDTSYRRTLMNRPVLFDHVFGTVLQPFFMVETLMLEGQQTLELLFFNNSVAGPAIVETMMETRKVQASALASPVVNDEIQRARRIKTFLNPYWFTTDQPVTIPAGGTATAFLRSTRDNYLILKYLMCRVITAGVAGDTQEVIAFTMRDAKTGRPFNNQPVTLNMGTGTAQFPFVLPTALMIEPATNLQVDFVNLITDAPTEVFFTFHGVACYVSDENPWASVSFDEAIASAAAAGVL
jgi:hypothetical protein